MTFHGKRTEGGGFVSLVTLNGDFGVLLRLFHMTLICRSLRCTTDQNIFLFFWRRQNYKKVSILSDNHDGTEWKMKLDGEERVAKSLLLNSKKICNFPIL